MYSLSCAFAFVSITQHEDCENGLVCYKRQRKEEVPFCRRGLNDGSSEYMHVLVCRRGSLSLTRFLSFLFPQRTIIALTLLLKPR